MTAPTSLDVLSERLPESGGQIQGGNLLTGGPGLTPLLVRETVQNAWDARDPERGNRPVFYEIHGFDLDEDERGHLRGLLPVNKLDGYSRKQDAGGGPGLLHPYAAISADAVRVLVISDRNTVGLCGPSRSGIRWDPVRFGEPLSHGQPRFANFVRNMGRAAKDIGRGDGGSYGVGKSSLWMASSCGTILIHTRTTDEAGNPVERFIGSIHGENFDRGDLTYTGRHFVGRRAGERAIDLIEPLVGAEAAWAASGLPLASYDLDGEPTFGTSIVIVAPRFNLDWLTEMERVRDAVRWHVWPKRVPGLRGPGSCADMDIAIRWNRHEVSLPSPIDDPEIRPYVRALEHCVTDRRDEGENRDFVAQCRRPLKNLGLLKFRNGGPVDSNVFHLTLAGSELARRVGDPGGDGLGVEVEPAVDFDRPWGQVALIRREPMLLVRYEPIGGPEVASTEVGVFLSADDPEVEAALTKAEPPAHDDWVPRNVPQDGPTDHRRRFAKRTIEEIRAGIAGLLSAFRTVPSTSSGSSEATLSAELSRALLAGAGGVGGTLDDDPPDDGGGGGGGKQPRAGLRIMDSRQEGDLTVHELEVRFKNVGAEPVNAVLTGVGSGQDSAGSMAVDGRVNFTWEGPDGKLVRGPRLECEISDSSRLSLAVAISGNLRVRPHVHLDLEASGASTASSEPTEANEDD